MMKLMAKMIDVHQCCVNKRAAVCGAGADYHSMSRTEMIKFSKVAGEHSG